MPRSRNNKTLVGCYSKGPEEIGVVSDLYPVSGNVFDLGAVNKQYKECWAAGHSFTDATFFRVSVSGAGAPPTSRSMNSNKDFYIKTDGTSAGTSVFFYEGSAMDPIPYKPFYGDILFNLTDLKFYVFMRTYSSPGWYKQATASVFS